VNSIGFVDIWHGPVYYELRQNPLIYSIFAQLLKNPYLTAAVDRANLNPPAYVEDPTTGKIIFQDTARREAIFPIHTDMNLWDLSEINYQGGLALQDCLVGGFQCIPGFHKLADIRAYRQKCEQGAFGHLDEPDPSFGEFYDEKLIRERAVQVPMEQGDYVVWSSRLPHSALANRSNKWRVHCYLRCLSALSHPEYREEVRRAVETGEKIRVYPTLNPTGATHSKWEVDLHQLPPLSPLGRRLLGLDPWLMVDESNANQKSEVPTSSSGSSTSDGPSTSC
jgi:hypothetical protein